MLASQVSYVFHFAEGPLTGLASYWALVTSCKGALNLKLPVKMTSAGGDTVQFALWEGDLIWVKGACAQ